MNLLPIDGTDITRLNAGADIIQKTCPTEMIIKKLLLKQQLEAHIK